MTGQIADKRRRLPRSIWILGFVSLLTDASSELIHSLLPLFITGTLGASMITLGLIEGIAEATAAITKIFSGTISDRLQHRKWLVVAGYGLSAITKPFFPLANNISLVFTARFLDRIGKGIRGAPRDALIADITPTHLRGAAYGLRQSLDSAGAFIGPLLAIVGMLVMANDIRSALWFAVLPAALAVLLLITGVKEPDGKPASSKEGLFLSRAGSLPAKFWFVIALGSLFTLARFSEAFLLLRAEELGLAITWIPMIMIMMNVVYAGLAYPFGKAADKMPAHSLLVLGLSVLVVADILLAQANSLLLAFAGAGLWGLHMALTQGLLAKLVADTAPATLRGTAFGIFNLACGIALLLASMLAGYLWSTLGSAYTFYMGAIFAFASALGLLLIPRLTGVHQ